MPKKAAESISDNAPMPSTGAASFKSFSNVEISNTVETPQGDLPF